MEKHSQRGNRKGADMEVHVPSPISLHQVKTMVPIPGPAAESPGKVSEHAGSWPHCCPAKSNPHGVGKFGCVCVCVCVCSMRSPGILMPHASTLSLELFDW